MVDRIERHDVVNAVMLAAVLLLLGFGIITALRSLGETVDDFVTSEASPSLESEALTASTTTTLPPESVTVTSTVVAASPPAEVTVLVANGADRRPGVAAAGSEVLVEAGYEILPPKNGPTTEESVIYYEVGFAADAVKVAELLSLEATQIEPMPTAIGDVPLEGANLVALLGINSEF
ncbi:MAG: LytR C-terminal domain-containing protein [Actinomycetota bacterium]